MKNAEVAVMNVEELGQPEPDEGELQGYEKIRTVGKGAFGLAVLYRRVSDGVLVVIKEVNMIELSATERGQALNEVQVLASLDHPNIIRYRRSFEREGQLMIEMEYADGGTLSQLLVSREKPLSERAVLHLYRQICAALRHMHERGVLHRDLKTANVFLTKKFVVKIGDFGISKVLTTRAQAQTILGTPYYISPEMCEGKQYGPKSDIWASGCILYEMICLVKAFEASNLPALINRIIRGQFDPIPAIYSKGLSRLVEDILQRDPDCRPSAAQLCEVYLPELIRNAGGIRRSSSQSSVMRSQQPTLGTLDLTGVSQQDSQVRSVLYRWRSHGENFDLMPLPLPAKIKVAQVAVGAGHFLVVTEDSVVYSWGEGSQGQLGHDNPEIRREIPSVIESLRGKNINKVAAGRTFSVFGSESGMLLTCGNGVNGCLGHGDWTDGSRPKIVERLLSVDVRTVVCGNHHVVALGSEGELFTWGAGLLGRLGLGNENNCCTPEEVQLPSEISRDGLKVVAGPDCTVVITTEGRVYGWGSNINNKLSLNRNGICGFMREIGAVWRPTLIQVDFRVCDVTMGQSHAVFLTPQGQIFTLGKDGVCDDEEPTLVRGITNKVTTLQCGPDYTIACTEDNVVYFWGHRHLSSPQLITTLSHTDKVDNLKPTELVTKPQEILALYGTENVSVGPSLSLGAICPYGENGEMLLLLHTSAPCPSERTPSEHEGQSPRFRTARSATGFTNSNSTIPEWLKAELAAAPDYSNYKP